MSDSLTELSNYGVSIWLDDLSRQRPGVPAEQEH
jgi:hypothetical protein